MPLNLRSLSFAAILVLGFQSFPAAPSESAPVNLRLKNKQVIENFCLYYKRKYVNQVVWHTDLTSASFCYW